MRPVVYCALVASACHSMASGVASGDIAALVAQPSAASQAEIRQVVQRALSGREVLLADDALTKSSLLIIERRRHRRIGQSLDTGTPERDPQRFRLVLREGVCELVPLNTDKRHRLTRTSCRAETKSIPPRSRIPSPEPAGTE